MPEDDGERTEQPTSRRREQAAEEGNFAVSRELNTFFVVLGGLIVLYFSGIWIFQGAAEFMKISFLFLNQELTERSVEAILNKVSYRFLLMVAPISIIPFLGAVSYVMQKGLTLSGKPLNTDFSRINPVAGIKRLFSLNAVAELIKSLLKISIMSYVVYATVAREWGFLPFLMNMETTALLKYVGSITFRIMTKTVWVLAVIAIIDYVFQRWNFEKSLRMTKQELKEEMKEQEGDPAVKARIRSLQRSLARKRMMQEVPKADVVVTNPTHFAVALKYDRKKARAPIVVAKGADHVAEKIKELARNHHVPVIENRPLAQSLYKHVEIGKEIPENLYRAVAEILAYVYRLQSRVRFS